MDRIYIIFWSKVQIRYRGNKTEYTRNSDKPTE